MNRKPYYHLCKQLAGAASRPDWPANARLVDFTAVHAPAAHFLLKAAYGPGGGAVADLDTWRDQLIGDPEYDARLVFPVLDNSGRMIAFAQCWTSGFVKDFVVDAGRRRQGLGEALLRHIVAAFSERGLRRVCLKVECDNPSGAERLYRRLGFRECVEGGEGNTPEPQSLS